VQTDLVEGFRLDRGFQVFLTAYPETRRILDYGALDLRSLVPGALVRHGGRFHRLADPWRQPLAAIGALFSPVGRLSDKLRVAWLRQRVLSGSLADLLARPERTTIDALAAHGFTAAMIERFFRPFFGGVFLERELTTSSQMFEFVFRMFAEGDTALPAGGMGAIPEQIARALPEGSIRLRSPVAKVAAGGRVILETGEEVEARSVVVATQGPAAARLLGRPVERRWRGVTCLYYAAERPPIAEPILVLDGDGRGPVNNLCVPSAVSPAYAPPGGALVSATVLGVPGEDDGALDAAVRAQLGGWFGSAVVKDWRRLRVCRIVEALPDQSPRSGARPADARIGPGLCAAGDHMDTASINGALASGRRAAEAILEDRG
jgi:phytoene dehydrogenase-like protein